MHGSCVAPKGLDVWSLPPELVRRRPGPHLSGNWVFGEDGLREERKSPWEEAILAAPILKDHHVDPTNEELVIARDTMALI